MSRYSINSSASKPCFVTLIFTHILRLIIQNLCHLLLKVLLPLKFTAKSTYRLLKQLLKNQINRNTPKKARHSSVLPGNAKCSVTSHTRWCQGGHHHDIYKYTSIHGPADFAGRWHHARYTRFESDDIINLSRRGAFSSHFARNKQVLGKECAEKSGGDLRKVDESYWVHWITLIFSCISKHL